MEPNSPRGNDANEDRRGNVYGADHMKPWGDGKDSAAGDDGGSDIYATLIQPRSDGSVEGGDGVVEGGTVEGDVAEGQSKEGDAAKNGVQDKDGTAEGDSASDGSAPA